MVAVPFGSEANAVVANFALVEIVVVETLAFVVASTDFETIAFDGPIVQKAIVFVGAIVAAEAIVVVVTAVVVATGVVVEIAVVGAIPVVVVVNAVVAIANFALVEIVNL